MNVQSRIKQNNDLEAFTRPKLDEAEVEGSVDALFQGSGTLVFVQCFKAPGKFLGPCETLDV